MSPEQLAIDFRHRFGKEPRLFYAPGRINLIGEHTDYNGGFVMPFALHLGTTVAAAARTDGKLVAHSLSLEESATIDLHAAPKTRRGTWLDYLEGMARILIAEGVPAEGADLLISSSIPVGKGLSSSAALEVSIGMAISAVANHRMPGMELALAANRAEHDYVGARSGIMDQFVSVFGRENHCLLIDCRSLQSEAISLRLRRFRIVVCDTLVRHSLASSEYNRRTQECEEAVRIIQKHFPEVQSLRDVRLDQFRRIESSMAEPYRRRCRHVVTENQRTLDAADALKHDDFSRLGKLMFQSHHSLRHDYEVTSPELDLLVDTASRLDGVAGARMTGGGFGGCTINLVESGSKEAFREAITRAFEKAFHSEPVFIEASPGAGAHEVVLG